MNLSIEGVFVISLGVYAALIAGVSFFYSRSDDQRVAHENLPKTVKYITEGFVGIIIFLLLFYLATKGFIPKEVLITLVAVFTTAGFLSIRNK